MARSTRAAVIVVVVAVVAVAGVIGVRKLWGVVQSRFTSSGCTVGAYDLDTSQAAVASTMVGAVSSYSPALPDRAAVLVLAAGLQESKLRNLAPGSGDRDSVGVLQQRPSQGWGGGDPAKLNNVTEATTEFLDHLVKLDSWRTLPLAEAIQQVQFSADGSLYAQHEGEAKALAGGLLGRRPAAITCTFAAPTTVALPAVVAQQLRHQLPVNPPTISGRIVRVPGASWQTAAWFVANADRLGIGEVGYDQRKWTRAGGWKPAAATKAAVTALLAK